MISVITMTYKRFDRLEITMRSVLSQKGIDIEYIIADDGSENFPRQRIEDLMSEYSFSNYILQHSKVNQGTVKNASDACKVASGDCIVFLSCGDVLFEEDTLKRSYSRLMASGKDVMAVRRIVYCEDFTPCNYLPHIDADKLLNRLQTSKQQYKAFITNHHWDAVSGSALYYKKSILEEMDYFDTKYYLWEDGPFLEKYLRTHAVEYAFDIIGIWYETGGVSTISNVNPLLKKDTDLYCQTDLHYMKGKISWLVDEHIDYMKKRTLCNTKSEMYLLWLRYPIVKLEQAIYLLRNRIMTQSDKREINKLNLTGPEYCKPDTTSEI